MINTINYILQIDICRIVITGIILTALNRTPV